MEISGEQFMNEVQQAIGKLPKVSGGQIYFSNDANKVLVNAEDEAIECMDDIVEHFVCIEEIIFDLINEKEDQLMFLGRIFI